MARQDRPPRIIPPPLPEQQEDHLGSSSIPQHASLPAQQAQSAASVQNQQPPPSPQPAHAASEIPVPAGVPVAAVPNADMDPALMTQTMQGFMQAQTALLQTVVAREQTSAAPIAQQQEPRVGTLRDFNSFDPPVFYGHEEPEDADAWLCRIQKLLNASHIPEADMVEAAQTKMDKMAGAWIASEMATRGDVMTWADFKRLFKQKFIPPSSQRAMVKKFVALTQESDDVSAYTHQFEILRIYATEILPNEESRIEWYINGLSSQLKPLVRACKPATLLEAQQSALQLEQDATEARESGLSTHKRPASQMFQGAASASVKTARTSFQARSTAPTASKTPQPWLPITCYACGRKGHKVADCWKKHRRCLRCGSADHKVAECPEPEDRGTQSVPAAQPTTSAVRGRASLPTQSTKFSQAGRAQGRGK